MENANLTQRLAEAIGRQSDDIAVDVSLDKRIITLKGKVTSRGEQIRIEDAVGRLAPDFTIIDKVKVEPY
ncbi:BON domain-containing protein [Ancylobacter sp. MQZ15Z-1]|uniref:BON domain-containing protein n=1 Tax=Ancylobacter mangrovi TaxID=2972472 RepID=A0A9X2PGP0_9HYPH|nr:BON domain-containing protein [Ancylobacter mangrovi]MCS0495705.1 BON domain-containing protein [Ancylobacter mangrovi]